MNAAQRPSHWQAAPGSIELVAVNAKQLGRMLGLSERTFRTLDTSGKLPRPVRIGGHAVRWVAEEVRAWLAAGAPTGFDGKRSANPRAVLTPYRGLDRFQVVRP